MDPLATAAPEDWATTRDPNALPTENLKYLDKLVAHCRTKGREVIFVRTPVHRDAPELENEAIFQKVRALRYADVEFLDFQGFKLDDDEFADKAHMNARGAERFSRWFALLVEDGLFDIPDKQRFIDENLKKL
jgi:hypothetical protein